MVRVNNDINKLLKIELRGKFCFNHFIKSSTIRIVETINVLLQNNILKNGYSNSEESNYCVKKKEVLSRKNKN